MEDRRPMDEETAALLERAARHRAEMLGRIDRGRADRWACAFDDACRELGVIVLSRLEGIHL